MAGRSYYTTLGFVILLVGLARGTDARAGPFRGGARLASASPLGIRHRRAPPTAQDAFRKSTPTSTSTSSSDRESAKEMMDAFLTRDSRNSFIARVYAVLAGQLAVTAASICLFGTNPQLTSWMNQPGLGVAVPIVSLIVSVVAWYIMCVSTDARRKSPVKWQLLALFTLGEAVSVGFISSLYKFRSVVSAMLATASAATGISVYTITQKNSKYDLSQWGSTLSSFGLIFMVYGLFAIFQMVGISAGLLPYTDMVYGMVGATLFSFYLAYHTKLIVAGKHSKYQMNEKDYVFGAMTLYNDIINLFIYVLKVLGEDRDH